MRKNAVILTLSKNYIELMYDQNLNIQSSYILRSVKALVSLSGGSGFDISVPPSWLRFSRSSPQSHEDYRDGTFNLGSGQLLATYFPIPLNHRCLSNLFTGTQNILKTNFDYLERFETFGFGSETGWHWKLS